MDIKKGGSGYVCSKCWEELETKRSPCTNCDVNKIDALDTQVGGGHYKDMVIQPAEFNQKNKIPYCEANAIKYLCRHRHKNGIEDLKKAKHYIDLLIQLEYGE